MWEALRRSPQILHLRRHHCCYISSLIRGKKVDCVGDFIFLTVAVKWNCVVVGIDNILCTDCHRKFCAEGDGATQLSQMLY